MVRLKAPVGGCTVRMYRHGLGDCFLLAFGATQRTQKYMLIDCGVLTGTADQENQMKKVVKNIRAATGDRLDVLVITHEHWDHVSGFVQAEEEFEKINVGEVWFAWTENPKNPLARELRERRDAALIGIHTALQRAVASPSQFVKRIESVRDFFGPGQGLGAAGRATTEDAMDWVKKKWQNHRYCEPGGAPIQIDGLQEVRFYVLGPPMDMKYIRKSSPSKGQVYLDDVKSGELGFYLAALGSAPAVREAYKAEREFRPFNPAFDWKPEGGEDESFAEVVNRYNQEEWRQIEMDWTGAAGELALKLDTHTNNTSLVLAIELGLKDKILLFTGDAQVGNWLSWGDVRWTGAYKRTTAEKLLERTVFYKVGHHGSHNATLREYGLEQMTNEELVAFIPVNRKMAEKRRWHMPYEKLYKRLKEQTLDRVVLADQGLPQNARDAALEAFIEQCEQDKLYIDYRITGLKSGSGTGRDKSRSRSTP
jgi:beta-lactamase superfamily II metal-dependent hydrolase